MGIRLQLEPRPETERQARDELGDLLRDRVDDGLLLDLQLIISELVTNSLRYGPGGTIEVEIAITEDGSITGEVEDHGRVRSRCVRSLTRDADPTCKQKVRLPGSDYERVRSDPTHFFVAPGHEIADVETVLESHPDWVLVEKDEGRRPRGGRGNGPSARLGHTL